MNETDHPFSAHFQMYSADGLRIGFTVRSNESPEHHLELLSSYLVRLDLSGYTVNLPGLEAGEETETIEGWVRGENSKGEDCIYLYAAGLKWKIATVWVECMSELPFFIDDHDQRWPGTAPEREMAEKKGYFHKVTPFKIVMEPTGKISEKSGKPTMKFARVHGSVTKQEPENGPEWEAAPLADDEQLVSDAVDNFITTAVRSVKRYNNTHAIKGALGCLGYTSISGKSTTRLVQYRELKAYAALRDAGMEKEKAVTEAKSQVWSNN